MLIGAKTTRLLSLVILAVLGVFIAAPAALADGAQSGEALEARITQAVDAEPRTQINDLNVYVEPNGTITVHGLVSSDALEERVLEIARQAGDGEVVHDQLTVINKGQQVTSR